MDFINWSHNEIETFLGLGEPEYPAETFTVGYSMGSCVVCAFLLTC